MVKIKGPVSEMSDKDFKELVNWLIDFTGKKKDCFPLSCMTTRSIGVKILYFYVGEE